MKPIFSIPLLLTIICFSISTSSYTPEVSKKLIQAWADNLHKAIKYGDKDVVATYFEKHASFVVCEETESEFWKEKWRSSDELYEYLAKNGTEAVIYVNDAYVWYENSEYKQILATLTFTGLGPPFVAPIRFKVAEKVRFLVGEYFACGYASMNCKDKN